MIPKLGPRAEIKFGVFEISNSSIQLNCRAARKPLVTLRDAAQCIIELPKAERDLPQWVTAIDCLMLVCGHGGDPMFHAHRNDASAAKSMSRGRQRHRARKAAKTYKIVRA